MDFFWYRFNITILILEQGSFNIGTRFKIHNWFLCYFNFERGYQKEKYHGYIKTTFKQHHFNIVFGNTQYLTNLETICLSHKLGN